MLRNTRSKRGVNKEECVFEFFHRGIQLFFVRLFFVGLLLRLSTRGMSFIRYDDFYRADFNPFDEMNRQRHTIRVEVFAMQPDILVLYCRVTLARAI